MIKINQLSIDGVSTADFDFPVYVTENAGFVYAKKKNNIIETAYGTGGIKDEVNAWPPIPKPYQLYCPTATLKDLRKIKAWAKDEGKLVSGDEADVFYEILDVSMEDTPIDPITGYRINISFITQPFGFEHNQPINTYYGGEVIKNDTNAPMYPKITLYGNATNQTSIKIGEQEIFIKRMNEELTIENKPLEQNVTDRLGRDLNSVMLGDFIEIPNQSTNEITLGEGINRMEMTERWAWL